MLARLKRACKLHRDDEAEKVRALAREILNDWTAITAFVANPDLPVLPHFTWFQAASSTRRRRRSKLARPYIWRLINLSLLIWPSA